MQPAVAGVHVVLAAVVVQQVVGQACFVVAQVHLGQVLAVGLLVMADLLPPVLVVMPVLLALLVFLLLQMHPC